MFQSLKIVVPVIVAWTLIHQGSPAPQSQLVNEEGRVQLCEKRLLSGIQWICRNPDQFYPTLAMMKPNKQPDHSSQRPLNIVEACCRQSCSLPEFKRFCAHRKNGQTILRTTTTTTTISPPQQLIFNAHHRFGSNSLINEQKTEAEIRGEIVKDALRCFYDPKCVKRLEKSDSKRVNVQLANNFKDDFWDSQKVAGKLKTFSRICSSKPRKNKEENQSKLLPFLLKFLTLGLPSNNNRLVITSDNADRRFANDKKIIPQFGVSSFVKNPRDVPQGDFPIFEAVTDTPFKPMIGFSLGLRDDIRFALKKK